MNNIQGKITLITGGATGIGLCYAKELLRNGLKGVVLADINKQNGEKASEAINEEFGSDRSIFVQTDVSDKQKFKAAFESTINKFQNVDILINNAGIMNDLFWEQQININLIGTVNGCLLAMEDYFPKYKSNSEGIIINIGSIAGFRRVGSFPIYSSTKSAIIGLSRSWGIEDHYLRTKTRVLCLCPGVTDTVLIGGSLDKTLGPAYTDILVKRYAKVATQSPENVSKALVQIINAGENGSVWVVENNELPYKAHMSSLEDLKKECM